MKTAGPDPKPETRRKPRGRRTLRSQVTDPTATTRAVLAVRECLACGLPAATGHHIIPKGAPHFGDDVVENIGPVCGSGTTECHGGIEDADEETRAAFGRGLVAHPEKIAYVLSKMGEVAGRDFLRRRYHITEV